MKIIVWLWNPWEKYSSTRHNLGFLFLEKFAQEQDFSPWKYEWKFLADISEGFLNSSSNPQEKVILLKPQTFMNASWQALKKIRSFYKLSPEDFTVIYDDISLEFGKIRHRKKWSAGGHNGIKDIIRVFGEAFPRIKVWVGNNTHYDVSDWVLSKFSQEELIQIDSHIYTWIYDTLMSSLCDTPLKAKKAEKNSPKKKEIYFVWIGWIWVSALARYYLSEWYTVYGSDSVNSELIKNLQNDGCDITIWEAPEKIHKNLELCIFSQAVPESQSEIQRAHSLWVTTLCYNVALWNIVNQYKLIAITGTHGKSTTTSMIAQIFQNSNESFKAIVGTLLKEFDGKNFYTSPKIQNLNESASHLSSSSKNRYFIIEACEYKKHFLAYKPSVAVITNIEYDHADFFTTPESYLQAYEKFVENIVPWGFCILYGNDTLSSSLIWKRWDIHYIVAYEKNFELITPQTWVQEQKQRFDFPEIILHIPGDHIMIDAKLAYIAWYLAGILERSMLKTLENYSGVWRRMEQIWYTKHHHLLMSDYGHHPTEISLTLEAIKKSHQNTPILTIFQPHQYSRTIELFEEFRNCFSYTDILIVPDIYESRDSDEDIAKMSSKIFTQALHHSNALDGQWMKNTLHLIKNIW